MSGPALERVFRAAGGRIVASLVARFRDLSLAEEAFAESCSRALETWPEKGPPRDPAAWLYLVAYRIALNTLRRLGQREQLVAEPPEPAVDAWPQDAALDDHVLIPDERLRLIFICCHPAVSPESRAALTLRLVCGLSVQEIARAFLVQEATLAQRLVRAKRKIAEAGVPFELPARSRWPERMEAVLSTLEIAYSKAHEDSAGVGAHRSFAAEMIHLTQLLTELAPGDGEAYALAALIRYAEARRPARLSAGGVMVPLSEQDPALWRRDLINSADRLLQKAIVLAPNCSRTLQARLQQVWCARRSLDEPPPWAAILEVYDLLLAVRDDPIVRVNRAVALAEVAGPRHALREIEALESPALSEFLPYQAARADLLRRAGRLDEARRAYSAALALCPPPAERLWLELRRAELR